MSILRFILSSGAAVAFLAGCAAQQHFDSTAADNAISQAGVAGQMSSSQQALIYTLSWRSHDAGAIYSYPSGTEETYTISPAMFPIGLCSDRKGDVFLAGIAGGAEIEEYAFGGTSPTASVAVKNQTVSAGCSVDPTTGNVATAVTSGNKTYVEVLPNFHTPAKLYATDYTVYSLGYDDGGNLFVLGSNKTQHGIVGELTKGAKSAKTLTANLRTDDSSAIQCDGKYVVLTAVHSRVGIGAEHWLYRFTLSGSNLELADSVKPNDFRDPQQETQVQTWIQPNRSVFIAASNHTGISLWAYPNAGKRLANFAGDFNAATIAAP